MKFEAVCTGLSCPTKKENGAFVQLLHADKLLQNVPAALDEDGNFVECSVCGAVAEVYAPAREEALFALGKVITTPKAKRVLAFNREVAPPLSWAEPAAVLIRWHVSGDHGSASPEIVEANKRAIEEGPLGESWGQIVSVFVVQQDILWVVTSRNRRETRIELPEEHAA